MTTALLYMTDFYVEACDAKVLSVQTIEDGRTDIVLDQTCFYARGGGQDWDMGTIKHASATFNVEEVRMDEAGQVHHFGSMLTSTLKPGEDVQCKVDHARRSVNTRLHSASHVIDMAVDSMGLDWVATKGQHYPYLAAVEYSGTWEPDKADELRAELEKRTNEFVDQGNSNSIKFMPVSKMHTICRHVPENIPTNKPGRVVIYGENFGVPCGGTHVKNIHDVGHVTIPSLKMKRRVIRLGYAVDGIMTIKP
jgi:Ser-tRNA(Ala) deacylase AlaX